MSRNKKVVPWNDTFKWNDPPSYLDDDRMISGFRHLLEAGSFWITLYFLANLVLTIHNKWVLSRLSFDFPWILTAIHTSISGLGSYIAVHYLKVTRAGHLTGGLRDQLTLLSFSLLYTINIAISNVSLNYVSLSFHQIVRSTNPIFTILLEAFFLAKHPSKLIYLSLVPVVIGVVFATLGEYETVAFDATGFFLTVLGVFLSAVKGIVTNVLMVGSLKLHPLDLLWRMAPLCLIQCLFYSYCLGELGQLTLFLRRFDATDPKLPLLPVEQYELYTKLLLNGLLAFALNWVSFTANKKTSALTMTVAGNVKQAMSIFLAVYIFSIPITLMNAIGILITLLGGAWYSAISYQETEEARRLASTRTPKLAEVTTETIPLVPLQHPRVLTTTTSSLTGSITNVIM